MMSDRNVTTNANRVLKDGSLDPDNPDESTSVVNDFHDMLIMYDPGTTNGNKKTPNSHSWYKLQESSYKGNILTLRPSGRLWQEISGTYGTYPDPVDIPNADNLINEALGQMMDQVRAVIDLSVAAGQGRQTAQMVAKAFGIVRYVKKFDVKSLRREYDEWMKHGRARAFGGKWLEFQYGWRPLAQDLFNTMAEVQKDFLPYMVCTGRATQRQQVNRASPLNVSGYKREEGWILQSVEYKCTFLPSGEFTQLISNFSSLNPYSILWELTPFSFVVDWFVDIGGYLRNLESAILLMPRFAGGYRTYSHRVEISGTWSGVSDIGGGFKSYWNLGGAKRIEVRKVRSVFPTMPLPIVPRFKMGLSSGRVANAVALLTQFWGKR